MRLRIAELLAGMVIALAAVAGGCDADKPPGESGPPRVAPESVKGMSVVRGFVRLEGKPPEMKPLANQPCHPNAAPITEEFVVVDPSGPFDGSRPVGLKNAFVFVESPALPRVNGESLPTAMLDQVDCRYVPHVVGVCVGQKLAVRSSDPGTMHNVHYDPQHNEARNFGMTSAGQEKAVAFTAPEFITVKCDVHPWMTAYIGVFDNPFFAVSGANGGFEIRGLPAGTHKLVVWHERYGRLEREVRVEDASPLEVEMLFAPPK